jgi:predicted ATP-grasp superfamily ATP-dependent carboligase
LTQTSILILALSARPYAQAAARSGFLVSVIDGFLDQDTLSVTLQAVALPFDGQGFEQNGFKKTLENFCEKQTFLGCLYGSGVEGNPALLAQIQEKMHVLGNTAETVKEVKNPVTFFATLDSLSIAHPQIFSQLPNDASVKMLIKSAHGAGGQHIRFAGPDEALKSHEYLQEWVRGEYVSVLFLVEKTSFQAHVIGVNLQWTSPTKTQPFRFGGIASNYDLSGIIEKQLRDIVQKLAKAFELVGLNSLDVVIQNEKIFILEINPRLSASVDLYALALFEKCGLDLIKLHIQSCLGQIFSETDQKKLAELPTNIGSTAMAIVYAQEDMVLKNIDWPPWVNDKPNNGVKILKESPICSVTSYESSALLAKSIAESKVKSAYDILSNVR